MTKIGLNNWKKGVGFLGWEQVVQGYCGGGSEDQEIGLGRVQFEVPRGQL